MTLEVPFGTESRPAVLLVPQGYTPNKSYPLIVYLHRGSARGDGISDSWLQSLPIVGAIREHPDWFQSLVLIPRCPEGKAWNRHRKGAEVPPLAEDWPVEIVSEHVDAALDLVLMKYPVDEDRISLTGKSLGGRGSFGYGAAHASRFAAIAPVAGFGTTDEVNALAAVPMWVFHGDRDEVFPVKYTRKIVDSIRAAGGDIRYTEYEGAGHGTAETAVPTYNNRDFVEWLLSQSRSTTPNKR